ncbi:Uncharacterized membrane-anchored protein [Caminicella sporogenes DSM 14501]|uniref:Uncharacterized membrane-anchored protein n=1 Tax=Caminicella sporogenes DSM 14501 TaxID=1121266 RepID=A0A1M6LKU7_9FIRM|nr:putative cytokinetic ring protein SteA [Caminicella sporogenes]RKD27867.1 thiamine pyrophosphokinase [Caminicella sporogenes]SHJ71814.1 Uncharacterized membrane-anchored protein [Caminicella sporogenes DSM 14501]
MFIQSIAKKDVKTKKLIKRLKPNDIAVIKHRDIDEVAALSLVEKRPKLVINAEKSISGKYPNKGPSILIKAGINIMELDNQNIFEKIKENSYITVINDKIYENNKYIGSGVILTEEIINKRIAQAKRNIEVELDKFIENTLEYAKKEKNLIIGNLKVPEIDVNLKNKHVLIVVRGRDYKKDLRAIQHYIREVKPILIGVDGGGDALLEFGYKPDILIGDMDSVSDECLKISKEIIVHAYSNGNSPGLNRIKKLGLECKIFPSPGTSEDIALLLAYEKEADFIVAVGTHTDMIDFLEKGRKGMASTFLVRLKVGSKLIDAKGVNKLYREKFKLTYFFSILFSSLVPILTVFIFSPFSHQILKLLEIRLKLILKLKGILW